MAENPQSPSNEPDSTHDKPVKFDDVGKNFGQCDPPKFGFLTKKLSS